MGGRRQLAPSSSSSRLVPRSILRHVQPTTLEVNVSVPRTEPTPASQAILAAMSTTTADPILLSLFANRFMGVAEAMGRALQMTSTSTNIKERLDFSCEPTCCLAPRTPLARQ